jgi:hypothetical protein
MSTPGDRRLAVAIHDVEPRSFARSREIREWLLRREVDRVTLLVIPAADLHPIGARAPALAAWLRNRVACGDCIAQHGLIHQAGSPAPWPRSVLAGWQGGAAAEFPGLEPADAARRVDTGRRLPRALRGMLTESYEWFADLWSIRLRSGDNVRSRALCLGTSTPVKRALSPALVRANAFAPGQVMRVDVHPADFDRPGHVATLESLLARARDRSAVTYDELLRSQ